MPDPALATPCALTGVQQIRNPKALKQEQNHITFATESATAAMMIMRCYSASVGPVSGRFSVVVSLVLVAHTFVLVFASSILEQRGAAMGCTTLVLPSWS
jgi:hypothetical protein